MPKDRDVRAFEERAATDESGVLGQLHRDISGKVADLAVSVAPQARRVLDVGSGTGYLLGLLAGRLPGAGELTGVDAASSMVTVARERAAGPGRPVLAPAVADAAGRTPRQGTDQGTRHPPGHRGRVQVAALAPAARGHHPGGHRRPLIPRPGGRGCSQPPGDGGVRFRV